MAKETRNDWNIGGKIFSVSKLDDLIGSMTSFEDEVRFQFSGKDYDSLKKHIEECAGIENCFKYQVSRIINVTNQGNKLSKDYTVIVKRIK